MNWTKCKGINKLTKYDTTRIIYQLLLSPEGLSLSEPHCRSSLTVSACPASLARCNAVLESS